jgi:hypothetical protein
MQHDIHCDRKWSLPDSVLQCCLISDSAPRSALRSRKRHKMLVSGGEWDQMEINYPTTQGGILIARMS